MDKQGIQSAIETIEQALEDLKAASGVSMKTGEKGESYHEEEDEEEVQMSSRHPKMRGRRKTFFK